MRIGILFFLLIAVSCIARSQSTHNDTPTQHLAFDVASIHINTTATDGRHHLYNNPRVSQFRTVNLSARELIQFAYGLPTSQVLGGPGWLDTITFDINAQSDPSVDDRLQTMSSSEARREKQHMVQTLLGERFQLRAHPETRQLPVYLLTVAGPKTGPKFQPSQINGTTISNTRTSLHTAGSDDTFALFTEQLSRILGRVVLNRTGLTGRYDLTLRWTPEDAPQAVNATADASVPPSIFTALEEQLGLKLESTKGPVPVLIVDSVEQPTGN